MKYEIEAQLLQEILDHLSPLPCGEVFELVVNIKNLKTIPAVEDVQPVVVPEVAVEPAEQGV